MERIGRAPRVTAVLALFVVTGLILNVVYNTGGGNRAEDSAGDYLLRAQGQWHPLGTNTRPSPVVAVRPSNTTCPSGFLGVSVSPAQQTATDALFEFSQLYLSVDRVVDIIRNGIDGDAVLQSYQDLHMVNSAVNLGANDGKTHDPLYDLFTNKEHEYSGLAVECDPSNMKYLNANLPSPKVTKLHACVSADNVHMMLRNSSIPYNVDVLKIDIDSLDCVVLHEILALGYRPKVLSIEVAYAFPPPILYCALQGPGAVAGHSCSLSYLSGMVVPLGYTLLQLDHIDTLFVRNEYVHLFPDCPHDEITWYNQGFAKRTYQGTSITGDPKAPAKGTTVVSQMREFPFEDEGGPEKMRRVLDLPTDISRFRVFHRQLKDKIVNPVDSPYALLMSPRS